MLYLAMIAFYGLYPIVTCLIYIITAINYSLRRPMVPEPLPEEELPFVTVIIPAFCEEGVIGHSIGAALKMDYPHFEVLAVNDGSTDRSVERRDHVLKRRIAVHHGCGRRSTYGRLARHGAPLPKRACCRCCWKSSRAQHRESPLPPSSDRIQFRYRTDETRAESLGTRHVH